MILPLVVGALQLLVSLFSYAIAMSLIVRVLTKLIQTGYSGLRFWRNLTVMALIMLIAATAHLTQIALWAVTFFLCGALPGFEKAFYFSAQNYTALGYGDVLLDDRWRLLGPLEAINGLLFFGLTTALLFAVVSQLIVNRLRADVGYSNAAGVKRNPLGSAGDAPWNEAGDFLFEHCLPPVEHKT